MDFVGGNVFRWVTHRSCVTKCPGSFTSSNSYIRVISPVAVMAGPDRTRDTLLLFHVETGRIT